MDIQGKSAKMWVHEICTKQLVTPKWDTKEAIPGQTPPTFFCRCTITYSDHVLEAEGSGKTKKEAMQKAATEMLFAKLEMTPSKLSNLTSNSKTASASNVSSLNSASVEGAAAAVGEDLTVSDTDEDAMRLVSNPVGDLLALCSSNEFDDPDYTDVKEEGPAHKKIFTVNCTVDEAKITCSGRRPQKKYAKKVAAFRALRKMKEQGYEFSSFSDRDQTDSTDPTSTPAAETQKEKEVTLNSYLTANGVPVGNEANFLELVGLKGYCDDTSEKCMQYCVNYSHVFQHLKLTDFLKELLTSADCPNNLHVEKLEKVATELGVQVNYFDAGNVKTDSIVFVTMKFPFNFTTQVPTSHTLHGIGPTFSEAQDIAAKEAINFIKTMMI